MHLAEGFKNEANLIAAWHKNNDLWLKMCFDETPENIKFFIELDEKVMLFKFFWQEWLREGWNFNPDLGRVFQTEAGEVCHRLRLRCWE